MFWTGCQSISTGNSDDFSVYMYPIPDWFLLLLLFSDTFYRMFYSRSPPELWYRLTLYVFKHLVSKLMEYHKKSVGLGQWYRSDVYHNHFLSNFFKKNYTAQKMKFSIKDFCRKCDQIRRRLF